MQGEKIQQLKDAMFTVLEDLTESDFFNMIEFNSDFSHWGREGFTGSSAEEFYPATEENKNQAIRSVIELSAGGGTNLNAAILAGLDVAEAALQREALPTDVKSLIVFLTDGLGSTPADVVKTNIKTKNRDLQTPVFTVAFGADTDLSLLQSIASQNSGVSRRIYEGSVAALQLEHFYAQISSPLLSNLKFEYVGGLDNSSISEREVNTFFRGGELIVSGKLSSLDDNEPTSFGVKISGLGKAGLAYHRELDICPRTSTIVIAPQCLQPKVYPKSEAQSFLQKLFAFQQIKQVLQKADIAETEGEKTVLEEKARELSLENNFVTDVTSLVVLKPDQEPEVTKLNNLKQTDFPDFGSSYASYAAPAIVGYSGHSASAFASGFSLLRNSGKPKLPKKKSRPSTQISNRSSTTPRQNIPKRLTPKSVITTRKSNRRPYKTTTTLRPTTTTLRPSLPSTSNLPAAGECSGAGNLTLYSQTYFRGEQLDLAQSQSDLGDLQWDNKAVSVMVTGSCCWDLHAGPDYTGDQRTVRPGIDYSSVTSLGSLFRSVASVRRVQC